MSDEDRRGRERALVSAPGDLPSIMAAMAERRRAGLHADALLTNPRRFPARRVRLPSAAVVFAELGAGDVVEVRPGGSGAFDVPDCARWWVQPRPARLTPRWASTVREQEIPGLSLHRAALTGDELSLLEGCPELRWLSLERCSKLDESELERLAALPQLEVLNLAACAVTAVGLAQVAHLPVLTRLVLAWCKLTDADLRALRAAPNLEHLCLYACRKVSDAGLAELPRGLTELDLRGCVKTRGHGLAGLSALRAVTLDGCERVDDEGLAALAQLGDLRALGLVAAARRSTPGGVAALARAPALRDLRAAGTDFGDEHAAALSSSTSLRRVVLSRTPITDGGVAHVARLAALEELSLSDTAVTAAGLEHLRAAAALRRLEVARTHMDLSAVTAFAAGAPMIRQLDVLALQGAQDALIRLARQRGMDLAIAGYQGLATGVDRLPEPPPIARVAWIATSGALV